MKTNRFKFSKYNLFFICLSSVIFFISIQTSAGEDKGLKHFDSLRERLVKDGFDSTWINNLFSNPRVSFEEKGVSLFLKHSEAKLDYDQFANKWSIKKAKKE